MTIEFHDHKDASARPRIEKIMERIRGFGLHVYPMSRHTYGDVVVVNPAHVAFGPEERARLVALKYTRGIRRAIGRRLGTYP